MVNKIVFLNVNFKCRLAPEKHLLKGQLKRFLLTFDLKRQIYVFLEKHFFKVTWPGHGP
jgi:hypothetical protein